MPASDVDEQSGPAAGPTRGRLTFDAEGQEGGPYHSRKFHVPSMSSGVTIGRGYDMKERTKSQVRDDLLSAGLETAQAALISQAAGLSGAKAEEFIAENNLENFELINESQLALFGIEYQRQADDTKRLATKADVTEAYGRTDWDALNPVIREVLIDLRFRGDYTPSCRKFLQKHVAANALAAFVVEIGNRDRWPNVPQDRFDRRKRYCESAVG